jgi:hypothetical protein
MLKHVGKHNDKKIVVLFREIPGDEHMCLVSYSDLLPRLYHDAVMKVLESPVGQQAQNFSDALFRNYMPDGRNCLEALHKDGLIKKVPTNQILITPTPTSSVRLDELNNILNEMSKGEEAVKRLAEIDSSKGMTGKKRPEQLREVGAPTNTRSKAAPLPQQSASALNEVLSNSDLAQDRIRQAEKMKLNATELIQEAERLLAEAKELDPKVKTNAGTTKKKTQAKVKED